MAQQQVQHCVDIDLYSFLENDIPVNGNTDTNKERPSKERHVCFLENKTKKSRPPKEKQLRIIFLMSEILTFSILITSNSFAHFQCCKFGMPILLDHHCLLAAQHLGLSP